MMNLSMLYQRASFGEGHVGRQGMAIGEKQAK